MAMFTRFDRRTPAPENQRYWHGKFNLPSVCVILTLLETVMLHTRYFTFLKIYHFKLLRKAGNLA